MARLNEPTNEPLEILKRRFVRQNRELARSNAIQSLKIRALETEIGRLVEENIALYHQNVKLSADVEELNNTRQNHELTAKAKNQIQEKMREMDALLESLGSSIAEDSSPRQRNSTSSRSRVSILTKPKIARSVEETIAAQGGLATIVEGKRYPRKSFSSQEFEFSKSSTEKDSLDLSLAPTSLLDQDGDIDMSMSLGNPEEQLSEILANLETRRKRKDTKVRPDDTGNEATGASPAKTKTWSSALGSSQSGFKVGAKRKLDWQDNRGAETVNRVAPPSPKPKPSPSRRDVAQFSGTNFRSPLRQPLGSKSVNNDPMVSPRKVVSRKTMDGKTDNKVKLINEASLELRRPPGSSEPPIRLCKSAAEYKILEVNTRRNSLDMEPETPVELDLFSPASLASEDCPPDGRNGTPPPALLSADGEFQAGRPSRRARAAVSYTEPSLLKKMRRPSKDLTDAVIKGSRNSLSMAHTEAKPESFRPIAPIVENAGATMKAPRRTITLAKAQPSRESEPDKEPQSPLSGKDLGTTVRRSDALQKFETNEKAPQDLSSLTTDIDGLCNAPNSDLSDVFNVTDTPRKTLSSGSSNEIQTIDTEKSQLRVAKSRRQTVDSSTAAPFPAQNRDLEARKGPRRPSIVPVNGVGGMKAEGPSRDPAAERRERIAARRRSMMV